MSDQTRPDTDSDRFLARVNVYGAGIAGLSAAHELMERGFKVRIIEYDRGLDAAGVDAPAIGGLARNQYVLAVKLLSHRWWETGSDAHWTANSPDGDMALPIHFENASSALSDDAREALRQAAGAITHRFGAVELELTAHAGDATSPEHGAALADKRANSVKEALLEVLPQLNDEHVKILAPSGALDGPGVDSDPAASALGRAVLVRPRKITLPGEHGFHFFPGYYRHLFNIMKRIPILDDDGRETGRTAFDNLTNAPHQSYAMRLPRNRPPAAQDLEQFQLRVHRYMTTCPLRRAAEFEDVSWWQFLEGWSPITRTSLYVYSPTFAHDTKFAGRVLAAFDAEWGDARTNGNTYIQLSLNSWTGKPTFDGILQGGETDTWFNPWRRYLETRGVEFVDARLESFKLVDGELLPFVVRPGAEAVPDQPADYYVSATDVVSAQEVTSRLPAIGVPGSLRGYTTMVPPRPASAGDATRPGLQESIVRDPHESPGIRPWDRLQTLSGIQFFFANEFKLVDGYMYFTDAEWALSSINAQQFWVSRPYLKRDGYISQMSVDIGSWMAPSKNPLLAGRSAWECTEREAAQEVWQQITASLLRNDSNLILPQPVWYNVDENIKYSSFDGRPTSNRTPYQIPIVGDWKNRPVGDPWDPTPQARNLAPPIPGLPEGLWQADHGGYLVHWGKLVFAGTAMRTFTRMTTMESANESARHAVNAIIDHVVSLRFGARIAEKIMPASPAYALNSNFLPRYPRPSPIGDYCQIWNPEENELASMAAARDYDELRFRLGLPHVMDASGAELATSIRSYQLALLNGWIPSAPTPDAAVAAPNAQSLLDSLKKVREELERGASVAAEAVASIRQTNSTRASSGAS